MTAPEAINQLLPSYEGYYDIVRENVLPPFAAEAKFISHQEQYFLVHSAKLSDIDSQEHIYFSTKTSLSFEELKSAKEFATIIDKAKSMECVAVEILSDKDRAANEESSGQLTLFAEPAEEKRVAVSISFGEKSYFADSRLVTSGAIIDGLKVLYDSNVRIITHGVKKYYKLVSLDDEYSSGIADSFFDVEIAAYLLNPLKSEPAASDIAKQYAGVFIPDLGINLEKEKIVEVLDNKRLIKC